MVIQFTHRRLPSTTGPWIDFAVFQAKSRTGNNSTLLQQLCNKARANGLNIDKSALAFSLNGRIKFFGTPDLVNYLSKNGLPRMNKTINF